MNRFQTLASVFAMASALLLSAGEPADARDRRDQDNLREADAQGQVITLNRLVD